MQGLTKTPISAQFLELPLPLRILVSGRIALEPWQVYKASVMLRASMLVLRREVRKFLALFMKRFYFGSAFILVLLAGTVRLCDIVNSFLNTCEEIPRFIHLLIHFLVNWICRMLSNRRNNVRQMKMHNPVARLETNQEWVVSTSSEQYSISDFIVSDQIFNILNPHFPGFF